MNLNEELNRIDTFFADLSPEAFSAMLYRNGYVDVGGLLEVIGETEYDFMTSSMYSLLSPSLNSVAVLNNTNNIATYPEAA